jgi:hypothetical protein
MDFHDPADAHHCCASTFEQGQRMEARLTSISLVAATETGDNKRPLVAAMTHAHASPGR